MSELNLNPNYKSHEKLLELILDELKYIRKDMNNELAKLRYELEENGNISRSNYNHIKESNLNYPEDDPITFDIENEKDFPSQKLRDLCSNEVKAECHFEGIFSETDISECFDDLEIPQLPIVSLEMLTTEELQKSVTNYNMTSNTTCSSSLQHQITLDNEITEITSEQTANFVGEGECASTNEPKTSSQIVPVASAVKPNDKQYVCAFCNISFTRKVNLDAHLSVHQANYQLPQKDGTTTSAEKSKLESDSTSTYKKKGSSYFCGQCGKGFKEARYLKKHLFVHKKEKRYSCKKCKREFQFEESLRRHNKLHSGDKTHQEKHHLKKTVKDGVEKKKSIFCNSCNQEFISLSKLNSHLIVHSHAKKFKCNFCKKVFKHASSLGNHKKIHISALSCSHCEKAFTCQRNLKKHVLLHSNKSDHPCPLCTKSFIFRTHMMHHMGTHSI